MDVTYVQRNLKPAVAKAVAANFLLVDPHEFVVVVWELLCYAPAWFASLIRRN